MPAEFVNLDARWLADLADRANQFGLDDEELARIKLISQRLEKLDEQVRNLQSSSNQVGEFERGVKAERERIFGRTNLPLQSVEVSPELRDALLRSNVPVKKIKRGVSGLSEPKPPKPVKRTSSAALADVLAGLKIDLSKL